MSNNKNPKKRVSFQISESNFTSNRNNNQKTSILKSKNKKNEKEEEKVQIIEEKKEKIEKNEIKIEDKVDAKSNNPIKNLPSDEYIKLTVQGALEEGLLNIALIHPVNPIKFLGNFLIEKSKQINVSHI